MSTSKNFLLNSCLTKSFSRNNNSYNLHTTKIICFLLVILSILIPARSQRTSTCDTSKSPQETPSTTVFCSPLEDSEYKVGQTVTLTWNPSNPNLAIEAAVEIHLIRKQQGIDNEVILNPQSTTSYLLVPREPENSINFTVVPEWFPDYKNSTSSENVTYTFMFRVIPKGHYENVDMYNSPDFKATESKPTLKSESVTSVSVKTIQAVPTDIVSTPSIDSGNQKKDKSENNKVFNVFIAVASVAAFLAFIAIVIAIKNRKRGNNQTKHSLSNLSTNSSTPMITPLSIGKFGINNNRDSESPAEAESIHSTTPLANKDEMRLKPKSKVSFENQPISASDAALLSDAFRKVLRKPDWKPEDEEDDDTDLSQEERLRRREAKELMKKELAEEGTDLQNISIRHTKVEIHNISDEHGASHSSESESK